MALETHNSPTPRHSLLTYLLSSTDRSSSHSRPTQTDPECGPLLPNSPEPIVSKATPLSPISEGDEELADFLGQGPQRCTPGIVDEKFDLWDVVAVLFYVGVVIATVLNFNVLIERMGWSVGGEGIEAGSRVNGEEITLCLTASSSTQSPSRIWKLQTPNSIPCKSENLILEIPLADKLKLIVGDEVIVGQEPVEGKLGNVDDEAGFLPGPEGTGNGGMRAGFGGPW